jgi:hypothetical protein
MSNYTYDAEENNVIESLKESAKSHFDQKDDDNILDHILGTLEYYMTHNDYKDFMEELYYEEAEEKSFNLTMIEEYEDGSALFEFVVTSEEREVFTTMGISFGLIKGILGTDSTDDILKWAQLGKEAQEKSVLGDDHG